MKRFQRLVNISEYLNGFRVAKYPGITPLHVVDGANATAKLATVGGDQLLVALPEAATSAYTETVSMGFFALARINSQVMTDADASSAYLRMLDLCRCVLRQLEDDLSGGTACPLIGGLDMTEASISPVFSVFGGWSGYILEVTLR